MIEAEIVQTHRQVDQLPVMEPLVNYPASLYLSFIICQVGSVL